MENYQVLCSVTKERARAVPGNKYRHLQAEEASAYMPWIATIRSALSRRTLELWQDRRWCSREMEALRGAVFPRLTP